MGYFFTSIIVSPDFSAVLVNVSILKNIWCEKSKNTGDTGDHEELFWSISQNIFADHYFNNSKTKYIWSW